MLKEDINGTKELIDYQVKIGKTTFFGKAFSKYQKVYAKTNENLAGYINPNYIKNGNALSVLASGDHIFNLILNGVFNIDTFDSNTLTKYYSLGLKKAAILKYDYKNYLLFIKKILGKNISNLEIYKLVNDLIPLMDLINQEYWSTIIDFNKFIQNKEKVDINLIQMLLINTNDIEFKNGYLENETKYNILKENLQKSNIFFKCCDCFDVPIEFKKQYDFILLSNIPDYFYKKLGNDWNYKDVLPFLEELKKMLSFNGNLFFAYCYLYNSINGFYKTYPIGSSLLKIGDLDKSKIITFPHISNNEMISNVNDGMIILKK